MRDKYKSRRWIVTVWSMLMITAMSVAQFFYDITAYDRTMSLLVAIPVGFTALETLNKPKMENKKDESSIL